MEREISDDSRDLHSDPRTVVKVLTLRKNTISLSLNFCHVYIKQGYLPVSSKPQNYCEVYKIIKQ